MTLCNSADQMSQMQNVSRITLSGYSLNVFVFLNLFVFVIISIMTRSNELWSNVYMQVGRFNRLTPPRIYAYACIQPINGEADCRSWMTLSSTSAACAPASHLVSRAGQDRSSFKEKEDLLRRVRTETHFKDCSGSLDSSSFTGSYFWSLLETHPVVDGQLQHHENQMQFRQEIFLTCNCRLCKISRR